MRDPIWTEKIFLVTFSWSHPLRIKQKLEAQRITNYLTHLEPEILVIHMTLAVPQFMGNPPVTVAGILKADGLNFVSQISLRLPTLRTL